MKHSKKIITLAGMALLLAACSNEPGESATSASSGSAAVESSEITSSSVENAPAASEVTNADFQKMITILTDKGFELSEPVTGENDVKGAKDNVLFDINKEDVLPFQAFEMDPDDENLAKAKDTGMVVLEFEGQEGEVPADLVLDHYIIFLPEGHPDRDEVLEVLQNEFKAE